MIEQYRNGAATQDPYAALVEPGRVHSDVYTNPAIFEAEIAKIFHRTWVYVGHDSEIPKPGDYKLRQVGRQPVIFVRGSDDVVRILMNRCRHRGAVVCEVAAGNLDHFRCWYHGWTYANTGKIVHVTDDRGYGDDFQLAKYDLTPAPRVEDYRGLYFASLDPGVEPLRTHLGIAAKYLDYAFDISLTGRLVVDAGEHKFLYRGNWKLVGMDGYHPPYVHHAALTKRAQKLKEQHGRSYRNAYSDDCTTTFTRGLGRGHCMLDLIAFRLEEADDLVEECRRLPGGEAWVHAMEERHGRERARELLAVGGDPHIGIFPNLQLINQQIRIITPVAVDRTEVVLFATRLEGVDEAINVSRLRRHDLFFSPAGNGTPDDSEIFERVQRGLMATVDPWVDISRGMHRERVDADGSIVGTMTDEVTQRGQMERWRDLMSVQ
jgi:phenylpropionate dioxygenase-like ring-hydroxylating dioxygenase large terminal subunit